MSSPRVIALRSLQLAVTDIEASERFYRDVWALETLPEDAADPEARRFRASGAEHHVLTLRKAARPGLRGVQFAARDAQAVRGLQEAARAAGATITQTAAALPAGAGGGYGFVLRSPDGLDIGISSDVGAHVDVLNDRSRPMNLTHVVLNSTDVPAQVGFFRDVLGFRLSDTTARMEFMRTVLPWNTPPACNKSTRPSMCPARRNTGRTFRCGPAAGDWRASPRRPWSRPSAASSRPEAGA